MGTDVLRGVSTRTTPQTSKAAPNQVQNKAGGFTFQVDLLERAKRFIILGTAAGTYYAGKQELTKSAAASVIEMACSGNHRALTDLIVSISVSGRAPRVQPAIMSLAVACSIGSTEDRAYALSKLPEVCRTGSHLLTFAGYIENFRGWGPGLKRGISNWYTSQATDDLAFQVTKYRQRGGWSHRDLVRLARPAALSEDQNSVLRWIAKGTTGDYVPRVIEGFLKAQEGANIPGLIASYPLSWEMLPTESLNQPETWAALLDKGMPPTALMRNLPKLTNLGLLPDIGGYTNAVAQSLKDPAKLKRGRVHPIAILIAARTYASGVSVKGKSTWAPSRRVLDALDAAFYAAYGAIEPTNQRWMLSLDVSGSMGWGAIADAGITAREASAALALVQMSTEPEVMVNGYTSGPGGLRTLAISPRQRLDDALKQVSNLPFGGTDCSLPFEHAIKNKLEIDVFATYTDNETYAGYRHPFQALEKYRQASGIDAKFIVVGMTATNCTIANPDDRGSMNAVGFDGALPTLMNDFAQGI